MWVFGKKINKTDLVKNKGMIFLMIKGVEVWPDGGKYDGQYHDGMRHGKGKFIWADGCVYEGEFKHNNMEGKGTI